MLRELDADHPHIGFLQGMASFGLEEAGHYGQALDAGLAAVAAHPDDVWAVHAVAHTYEMQGPRGRGHQVHDVREHRLGTGNLFTVHLWWHLGLYHLEAGRIDDVLSIYDAEVHQPPASAARDARASAMLWRLRLDGVDTGDRFAKLADAWQPHAAACPVLNDLHAVMADVGANRFGAARRGRPPGRRAATTATGTNRMMTAEVGLPASRAVIAHAEERFGDVVAELLPIRRQMHWFGGSHAQRDVLQRTSLDAAIRDGQLDLARADRRAPGRARHVGLLVDAAGQVLAAQGDATGSATASTTVDRHRCAWPRPAERANGQKGGLTDGRDDDGWMVRRRSRHGRPRHGQRRAVDRSGGAGRSRT